ncbi:MULTISPECIES: IS3 family transposase [Mycobacteriaceae]|uniref:IS3 family transposase n=2 Tax=Mycobacteriaceae TaxID=1762 RepID=A0AA94RG29_9MYCO|nr:MULTISPECIES: IS3 family transposase [Mycobacteriaceae]MCX8555514.1 IS3 family transposase [Mycolicibacterium mucogenicum]MCX8557820.1 IS3 family transposase [Mycolicibacterium mucogenicum]TLH72371.1 IS3 family transposase [Mycolicibacterium phocaicum]UCZ63233.1 IS3 family transposase [Mycolicibacterium phocaicum]UCZ63235.1 IS3 family transposase [Mycolicibacterium phocaicum]
MAGRKRHSAEDIVRKLRRADELAAEGKTGEEIAAELGVSPATLYNWRRAYGGMDTDAARELKELREQNARLKRLLAEAELEKDALREVAKGKILSPAAKRRAVDMLKDTLSMSERLACKAVGLARSTYRNLPMALTPSDPDADMRVWLRSYATKHPCHGFRRAWAALRYDERREVNKKKIHRLWREEGLQVKVTSPRKRSGVSSCPPEVIADAPKVVWAIDFQFDSTVDGKAIKIASMLDEHTRESLLNIVERSITAQRLVAELEKVFAAAGGPPMVLRMDNGPEFISAALQQFCDGKVGLSYIPPGTPWNNGYIESFNNRLRKECLNRNHWNTLMEARVVIGDFKADHNLRHRHSALGYRTPAEYAAVCTCSHTPMACEIN